MGKRKDQTGSEKEGNVPVWKQSVYSVAEQGEGCSFFLTILTASSPQQHPSVHEDSLGLVVLCTQRTTEDVKFISRGRIVSSAVR